MDDIVLFEHKKQKALCVEFVDNTHVAIGCTNGTIRIQSICDESVTTQLYVGPRDVLCMSLSPDKRYLAVGCAHGFLVVYSWPDTRVVLNSYSDHLHDFMLFAWRGSALLSVTSSEEFQRIECRQIEGPRQMATFLGPLICVHRNPIVSISWPEDTCITGKFRPHSGDWVHTATV